MRRFAAAQAMLVSSKSTKVASVTVTAASQMLGEIALREAVGPGSALLPLGPTWLLSRGCSRGV